MGTIWVKDELLSEFERIKEEDESWSDFLRRVILKEKGWIESISRAFKQSRSEKISKSKIKEAVKEALEDKELSKADIRSLLREFQGSY